MTQPIVLAPGTYRLARAASVTQRDWEKEFPSALGADQDDLSGGVQARGYRLRRDLASDHGLAGPAGARIIFIAPE